MVSRQDDKIEPSKLGEIIHDYVLFPGWPLADIMIVLFHICSVAVLTLPIILLGFLNETAYSDYSLNDPEQIMKFEDLMYDPANMYLKMYRHWSWNTALTIIAGFFWAVSFVDLIIYYSNITYPPD